MSLYFQQVCGLFYARLFNLSFFPIRVCVRFVQKLFDTTTKPAKVTQCTIMSGRHADFFVVSPPETAHDSQCKLKQQRHKVGFILHRMALVTSNYVSTFREQWAIISQFELFYPHTQVPLLFSFLFQDLTHVQTKSMPVPSGQTFGNT